MVKTSSGDVAVTAADAWAEVATPLNGTNLVGGPQATVIGTPAPFGGAMTFTGNWLHDTFDQPAQPTAGTRATSRPTSTRSSWRRARPSRCCTSSCSASA